MGTYSDGVLEKLPVKAALLMKLSLQQVHLKITGRKRNFLFLKLQIPIRDIWK
jgi:hypothetical protein